MPAAVESAHRKIIEVLAPSEEAGKQLRRYLSELFFEGETNIDRLSSAGTAYLSVLANKDRSAS